MKTATQEQLAALTLPATLPGVVRRGTPLQWGGEPCLYMEDADMHYGDAVLADFTNNEIQCGWLSECSVDLTDATGRAHVAWAVGKEVGCTFDQTGDGGWTAGGFEWYASKCKWGIKVPGLGRLNRHDATTLPDGSRLVDVLALQAVALHVLGGGA